MGFWEPLLFWILAAGAVVTSIGVLAYRNPLYSALSLIVDFFCFAGLYALLSAHFLAVTQILVYAGAIMVLFVFIIMLLNLSDRELGARRFNSHHILAVLAGGTIFVFAAGSIGQLIDKQQVEVKRAAGDASEQVQSTTAEMLNAIHKQKRKERLEAASGKEKMKVRQSSRPVAPSPKVAVGTPSHVPGLYADLTEYAVRIEFHDKIQAWNEGTSTPAEGKYRTFDPDHSFELPPALKPDASVSGPEVRGGGEGFQGNLFGTVEPISILLVNRFVIPFELTAVLLLAGIIGAVIIAKKRL